MLHYSHHKQILNEKFIFQRSILYTVILQDNYRRGWLQKGEICRRVEQNCGKYWSNRLRRKVKCRASRTGVLLNKEIE